MATRYIGQNYASWNGMYYTTLTGADRNGSTARAHIYLEEEYDTANKRSRVRIVRIAMDIPPHCNEPYPACSKTDLYKTGTSTGSWVKLNGETLFNCYYANQYGLNLQVSNNNGEAGGTVKPYSNYNGSTQDGAFSSSWGSWIYYEGAKSISLAGYFTWATSGATPYDTTGGINTSTSVSLYTMPVSCTITVQDRVSSPTGVLLGSGTYTVNSGTTVSASSLRSTTYTGYTYSSCTSATVSGATTLYRYFTPNTYKIEYRNSDINGTVGNFPEGGNIKYGESISPLNPTNSYIVTLEAKGGSCSAGEVVASRPFVKWSTGSDGSGYSFSVGQAYTYASDTILYAQWGTVPSVTLPVPTRPGCDFLGWASSPAAQSGISGAYTPSGSTTLYAIWKVNGAVHIPIGGKEHAALVWIYHSNKWRRGVPKEYTSAGGVLKYHTCG